MTQRIATICARGGSKGVPGKNMRPLYGMPLISHTIKAAQDSGLFQTIAVSSDDKDILEVADALNVQPITRPDELATDKAGKLPAITHALNAACTLNKTQYTTLVDLDATSPLRSVSDIKNAVDMLEKNDLSAVITAAPSHRSPYFNMVEIDRDTQKVQLCNRTAGPLLRRQDAPETYDMNASIYVWNVDRFLADPKLFYDDTGLYVMPKERSWDIDTPLDFEIVEFLMQREHHA